ncbi:helix-turn-helix domain-containing protein [Siphonobacter sp.]|uniref:helix-turn-helix domain-containing protein n=1 Tax=Siphonobacter sp. TaxID=1869184 RepID=UPI003B3B57F8
MQEFIHFATIADLLRFFGTGPHQHPLVAVLDFSQVQQPPQHTVKLSADFYSIMFKTYPSNHIRYGRKPIDFQDGCLISMGPNQVLEMDVPEEMSDDLGGWGLYIHPDLIRGTSLHARMQDFHFFSYEVSESLHLSEKEKGILLGCLGTIQSELQDNIDGYSQPILVAAIELFLQYCDRFYGRQFITRQTSHHGVVVQIDKILSTYFKQTAIRETGLPTVKYLAEAVHLSPSYLSDLLKKETGRNAQDHIHYHLIEEAKTILLSTEKSVGEIAYSLGFEYPQYFNKLFKQKTGRTPVEFRNLN